MKKNIKSLLAFSVVIIMFVSCITVNAATIYTQSDNIPYDSYTYWQTSNGFKPVYTKPLYSDAIIFNANKLGVRDYKNLIDVSVDDNGYVYLLDGEQSRITVLTPEYEVLTEITSVDDREFAGAKGILAHKDVLYIADTKNERVIITNQKSEFLGEIVLPDSPIIPDDFTFRPIKLTVDRSGYTYILSDGSFYGAILYSPGGEFLGFYGSNSVETGLGQTLLNFFESLTMTNDKKAQQASKIPYQFTDLYTNNDNFVYTATGKTTNGKLQTSVLRMLAPNGINILPSTGVTFGENEIASAGSGIYRDFTQNIAGLAVDDNGYIHAYDTTYSRIYVYDKECNLLCAFSGGFDSGQQNGSFKFITSIDVKGDDILVTDGTKNTLTIFKCNNYGKKLKSLQKMTLEGDYLNAKYGWQEIHSADANNRFAYIGLAKAAYSEGDYATAKELSKKAYDVETYAIAFEHLRKEWLRDNFTWIFIVCLCIVGLFFLILKFFKKEKNNFVLKEKTKCFLQAAIHPATTFSTIKQKKLASYKFSFIAIAFYYISEALKEMFGSFLFEGSSSGSFNSIMLLLKTVGIVVLWTITNWGVCTLFGGIGKSKEILTVVSYSLIPLIMGNFGYTILTHLLVPDEAAFLGVIMTVLTLYTFIMIIIGTIIIHDFSFGKFIGTTLLTLVGIAIVLFVGIIIVILVQQLAAFGITVYNELLYR